MAVPFAVVALVGLLLLEFGGRIAVERAVERHLRDSGTAERVDVVVGREWWLPSVVPAVLTRRLDRVSVDLRDVRATGMPVDVARYSLHGLRISVSVPGGALGVSAARRVDVRLLVDPRTIGEDMGVEATAEGDQLLLGEHRESAELKMAGDDLVVRSEALSDLGGKVSLPLVDPWLLPCTPQPRVRGGLVDLRCSGERLPAMLDRPLTGQQQDTGPVDLPRGPVELEPPATLDLDGGGSAAGEGD